MSQVDVFKEASRRKLRFGGMQYTAEQLWDLPLTTQSANKASIEKIGNEVLAELKTIQEGSFISSTPNPRREELELMVAVLTTVRDDKQAENAAARKAAADRQHLELLLRAREAKQNEAVMGMSLEELDAQIAELRS